MYLLQFNFKSRLIFSALIPTCFFIVISIVENKNDIWSYSDPIIATTLVIFVGLTAIKKYFSEASNGWKRLSLVASIAISGIISLIFYFDESYRYSNIVPALVVTCFSIPPSLLILLYSKTIYFWIKEGFASDKNFNILPNSERNKSANETSLSFEISPPEKSIDDETIKGNSSKTINKSVAPEDTLTYSLSTGMLAMTCKLAFMMVAWSPVNYALNRSGIRLGALWISLIGISLGYAGYRFGQALITSICNSRSSSYTEKRRNLWLLLFGAIVFYFMLFVFVGVIVPSTN